MKSKKTNLHLYLVIIGIGLLVLGLISVKMNWFEQWQSVPYILVGIGCGVVGHNLGSLIQIKVMVKNPKEAKKIRIEQKDERNRTIQNMAKSKAFDAMIYIFGVLILIVGLLNAELIVTLLLVGAYLLVNGIAVYYSIKFQKEM